LVYTNEGVMEPFWGNSGIGFCENVSQNSQIYLLLKYF